MSNAKIEQICQEYERATYYYHLVVKGRQFDCVDRIYLQKMINITKKTMLNINIR